MAHDSQQRLFPRPHPHAAISPLEPSNTISRGVGGPRMKVLSERRVADAKYSCGYWFAVLRDVCRRYLCSIESPDEHPILSSSGSPRRGRSTPELSSADANISSNRCTRNTYARLLPAAGQVLFLTSPSTHILILLGGSKMRVHLLRAHGRPFAMPQVAGIPQPDCLLLSNSSLSLLRGSLHCLKLYSKGLGKQLKQCCTT